MSTTQNQMSYSFGKRIQTKFVPFHSKFKMSIVHSLIKITAKEKCIYFLCSSQPFSQPVSISIISLFSWLSYWGCTDDAKQFRQICIWKLNQNPMLLFLIRNKSINKLVPQCQPKYDNGEKIRKEIQAENMESNEPIGWKQAWGKQAFANLAQVSFNETFILTSSDR